MKEITTCRIWGSGHSATGYTEPDPSRAVVRDSPRAGGGYKLVGGVKPFLENMDLAERSRLTTWLVDQRIQGVDQPEVTEAVVSHLRMARPLQVHERADRLLRFLARATDVVGNYVEISPENCDSACAWSESTDWREVHYFLGYLVSNGWLEAGTFEDNMFKGWATVDGHSRIAEQEVNLDSAQAFVAMWFDKSMNEVYSVGIEPGIRKAGYRALKIDREEYIDKIDDRVVAGIRRSRFLVADFTQGRGGARGGVYYEAGFAYGLGIPVFYTCRADLVECLHLDTRQYNHILWKTPDELRESLRNRIRRVLGDSPEIYNSPPIQG